MLGRTRFTWRDAAYLLLGLMAVLAVSLWVAGKTGASFLTHSAFDSYTKQAIAWRNGHIALDQNYPWLELAVYNGHYYVSFPPVPAIPMWLLSFVFGGNTPSGLMTLLYLLGAYAAFFVLMRRSLPGGQAALLSAFVCLGGSVLDLAVSGGDFTGGVWYQAQLLGLLLTALSFCLLDAEKSTTAWAAGLICIALAVGCRPFNAIYVPVLLWLLYNNVERVTFTPPLVAMLPFIIVPALIAVAYGAYNFIRFGNPLEFGHSYLPELAQAGEGMFVPSRLWTNLGNIMRMPKIQSGTLIFPVLFGFAFYLTNPMILMGAERTLARATRKQADITDAILGVSILLHAIFLLMHRTNGGWQYGTRYLCDLLPALVFLSVRGKQPLRNWEIFLMGVLIVFNLYGTIVFHWL